MKISDFTYDFSAELIANQPASPRDSCALMVLDRKAQSILDFHFFDLPDLLKPGDLLVFNDSKVIPARILFAADGKKIEIFLLRPLGKEQGLRQQHHQNLWLIMGKPGKILKKGAQFKLGHDLTVRIADVLPGGERIAAFSLQSRAFEQALSKLGVVPLPPYIKNSPASFADYQTVYAKEKGSVAAPTAGLHFTKKLLEALRKKGIQFEFVTLHVGPGTFLPVKTEKVEDHRMHGEFFEIDAGTAGRLNIAKKEGRRIIAVGTTSVRVLESNCERDFSPQIGETNIFIYPGYRFRSIDGLITNFHLPKSTLLLLTCAFGGKDFILKAYAQAVQNSYRFYSFGDAMLIL